MLSVHLEAFIAHSTHQESQAELIQNTQLKNNEIQLCLLQCFHSNILNDVFSLLAPWCLFPFCFICLLFFQSLSFLLFVAKLSRTFFSFLALLIYCTVSLQYWWLMKCTLHDDTDVSGKREMEEWEVNEVSEKNKRNWKKKTSASGHLKSEKEQTHKDYNKHVTDAWKQPEGRSGVWSRVLATFSFLQVV